jgi:hypothetical protein
VNLLNLYLIIILLISSLSHAGKSKLNSSELDNNAIKIVTVPMGKFITTNKPNVILKTDGLTYCFALALLKRINKEGNYQDRTLMHINGGNLDSCSNKLNLRKEIEDFTSSISKNERSKIILIAGRDSQENHQIVRTLSQRNKNERSPLLEVFKIKNASVKMAGSINIELKPNGEFTLSNHNMDKGLLDDNEVSEILTEASNY